MKKIWILCLVVLSFLMSVCMSSEVFASEVGELAPQFTAETIDGKQLSLKQFHGKKIVVNFFATWCPPCKAEIPEMVEFYNKNNKGKVHIIAVNLTSSDHGKKAVQSFAKKYKMSFPIVLDENGKIGSDYKIFTIPTSFFIDEKGRIVQKIIGPLNESLLDEFFKS